MKRFFSIICGVFFINGLYSQAFIHVGVLKNEYYSLSSCSSCKDTLVDASEIESFYIMNPTSDIDGVTGLSKMINLKELWLEGNDVDSFKSWNSKQFSKLVPSNVLKVIHIQNIESTEKFKKFIKTRYKGITIKEY